MNKPKYLLPDSDYHSICTAIASSVRHSFADPSHTEPQMVANLVYHMPHAINNIPFSGKHKLSCNGIFIHQTPKVTCKDFPEELPASVELGDLLLLITDCENNKRALLLQAKKTNNIPVKPDNTNQYHLYAKQPHFKYVNSGKYLTGEKRRITGLDVYNGCKYVLILEPNKGGAINYQWDNRDSNNGFESQPCVAWVAQPTWPELTHYRSFEQELVDFIIGYAGKPYNSCPHGNDKNWDRVIEDLIKVVSKKVSSLMSAASSGTVTTRGNIYSFLSGQPFKSSILTNAFSIPSLLNYKKLVYDGPPEVPPLNEETVEDSHSGISIVELKWTKTQEN